MLPDVAYDLHTIQYQYDLLSRLLSADYYPGSNLSATPFNAYEYAYDLAGNRLSESLSIDGGTPTVTNYTYNAANQITNAGFTYDNNGNLTSDGTNTYTWDRANRLLSMGGASYAYDGIGNRVQQTVGVNVTQYLLDLQPGLAVVLAETQGANTTRYVHGPTGIHAHKDSANNWEWIVQDGLGSVRSVADNNLNVLWTGSPEPYGVYFSESGTRQSPYLFTGEYTDPITGLIHLRARDYNPALGVFPSLDPFEGKVCRLMSLNGYSWVEGNVINAIDPSGMACVFCGTFLEFLCFGACAPTPPPTQPDLTPTPTPCPTPTPTPTPVPRVSLTASLGSPANDVMPHIGDNDCASFNSRETREACETLKTIQDMWPSPSIPSGPTYGEIVALVIGTEWYPNRSFTGNSGTGCNNLQLGDVMELAMANQFWYWYRQPGGSLENIVRFLSYFEPIREQEIGNRGRGTIFEESGTGGVLDLISKTGIYSESDLTSYLSTIFGSSNPFAVFTQSNPGQAASNCPYGFANVTGRTTQSYSTGDALVEFPNNFKVISFAQQVGSSPSSTACGSFEALRTQANCQPQPLSGLP